MISYVFYIDSGYFALQNSGMTLNISSATAPYAGMTKSLKFHKISKPQEEREDY